MHPPMSLRERIAAEIAATGPISVADYMTRCLHDPAFGYYATRPAIGEDGDFITAPMVSQMFGELIGLWAVETWRRLGAPRRLILVEVGPGDGTLMCDALRAAGLAPDFLAAAELWLVETSDPLVQRQKAALAHAPLPPRWIASLSDLPDDAPLIVIANEVLDCLPVQQLVRTPEGWAERRVGLDAQGGLAFGLGPVAGGPDLTAAPGAVIEVSPAQAAFGAELARRVAGQGGAALLIDYGRAEPGFGDTLQALRRHKKVDPLACPGEADLTVHADFLAVLAAASDAGAASAIASQGAFLRALGVEARAAALAHARPDQAPRLARQLERLIGDDQMGLLFKAACIHAPALVPPGFEAAS
jgi:NADH dehydrogenase [ubiquinone] 1 alpha subcomplex assembly factor 7